MYLNLSLPNLSDQIRWSFEIRYQKQGLPWGFYDLIDGIQLCTSEDKSFKPDWSKLPHESNVKTAVEKSTQVRKKLKLWSEVINLFVNLL